ncbi:hypothetical protein [Bacillus mycoides]|uniref:hypothetical protein n=1 Tax=Bacillus mycoides TaxID=1405 RepID=UPI000A27F7C9|nr:hypothetical protein [Bacillus mycoides]OSY03371.1 hypothetical protein BTJ44_05309 [Bacillus mycoides]
MGIEEIIVAAVKAYLEREKAKQDAQRSQEIIQAINDTVIENQQVIQDALEDLEINRLTGLYLGQVENFKEYKPRDDHKYILENIAFESNGEIFGPLIQLYGNESDVERIRKIVRLMVLVSHLRGLVMSELKFRHNDDRDADLLVQLKYVRDCCERLRDDQDSQNFTPAFTAWRNCEANPPIDTVCIPTGEDDPWGEPTTCCIDQFNAYKPQRDLLNEDNEQLNNVEEAISHLGGSILLKSI